MIAIDADEVLAGLSPLDVVAALRAGHVEGVDQIDRLLLTEPAAPDNHLLTWFSWIHGKAFGAKLAAVFPRNAAQGRGPNVRTVYVLFDGADGAPLAAITGDEFTRTKTAADSALGADFLAPPSPRVLLVMGAGAQARAQARFHCAVRPSIETILLWNRTRSKAEELAAELAGLGRSIAVVGDPAAAAARADVICCVTATKTPVLHGAWVKAGTHVDLVGGFTPDMREGDDELIRRARLYADTRRFTLDDCGDYAQPLAAGVIAADRIEADLFDLCRGAAAGRRADPRDITVFKNGGGGHLDLMMARMIYARATGRND